ncbi:MAG: leucine-rich repeat domain-containing protein, partial [Candidatus Lokiarchaeota archaeon]|nr:leucine-rich repeat domain-containing protein [Candidatus Lokiarchaeota archaeon]
TSRYPTRFSRSLAGRARAGSAVAGPRRRHRRPSRALTGGFFPLKESLVHGSLDKKPALPPPSSRARADPEGLLPRAASTIYENRRKMVLITKPDHLSKLSETPHVIIRGQKRYLSEYADRTEIKMGLLDLSNLGISNLREIKGLDAIEEVRILFLQDNCLTSLEHLPRFPRLEQLDLSNNKIRSIKSLENQTSHLLETLWLGNNQISCIEGLENVNLRYLDLSMNNISKIANIDHMIDLEELYLSRNEITKIEGLETLVNLKRLHLSHNGIKKIEGLKGLKNLKSLHLSYNPIQKIENLEANTRLEHLFMAYTNITRIENLDHLTNLQTLRLEKGNITRIEGLSKLINLEELFFHNLDETINHEMETCVNYNDYGDNRAYAQAVVKYCQEHHV